MSETPSMDTIVNLAKRRGFIFAGSEIYGGLANSWDYGPLGVELKNNIKQSWWKKFVRGRQDVVGIDAAIIMNPKVWEASGHVSGFSDPLVECKNCHERYRLDKLIEDKSKKSIGDAYRDFVSEWGRQITLRLDQAALKEKMRTEDIKIKISQIRKQILAMGIDPDTLPPKKTSFLQHSFDDLEVPLNVEWDSYKKVIDGGLGAYMQYLVDHRNVQCPNCQEYDFTHPHNFNLMFKTSLGPSEESANEVYLRPETAQAMFVDFPNVLATSRKKLPFGIAQIGRAFRNEITPGNFIFRTREFEQMEIEYFVKESNWKEQFELWLKLMHEWIAESGIDASKVHDLEIPEEDRAHYSSRTVDIEFDFPFGRGELYGLAYRSDFDLKNHMEHSGKDLSYLDTETNEKIVPHVIEPTFGVDRTILAILASSYKEEEVNGEKRVVLALPAHLAPYQVAVLPLMKKPELTEVAKRVTDELSKEFSVEYDETQSIGKRYRRQDEIGTPYCVTVDYDSLKDNSVTVRDRDSMKQERIEIAKLQDYIQSKA